MSHPVAEDFSKMAARVQWGFENQSMMQTIGASMVHIAPGEADIKMPNGAHIRQQAGFVHGGAIGMIADSAAGFAAYTNMKEGQHVLTIEYKINLLSPAVGDYFIAKGRVLRAGKQVHVAEAKVYAVTGEKEKLIAVMVSSLMMVEGAAK